MRPGLDNHFLLGGPSSGPVFPVKIGQVGMTSVGRMWSSPCIVVVVIVVYFELGFKLPLFFELCRLYLKLLCKTCVVN